MTLSASQYINNSLNLARKYVKTGAHGLLAEDICPWTLIVPRSEQFSESVAQGNLWVRRNR